MNSSAVYENPIGTLLKSWRQSRMNLLLALMTAKIKIWFFKVLNLKNFNLDFIFRFILKDKLYLNFFSQIVCTFEKFLINFLIIIFWIQF
jgi:hypothetical protein